MVVKVRVGPPALSPLSLKRNWGIPSRGGRTGGVIREDWAESVSGGGIGVDNSMSFLSLPLSLSMYEGYFQREMRRGCKENAEG